MAYDPGEFDKWVDFYELCKMPDGGGGFVAKPNRVFSCWALFRPLSVAEKAKAGQLATESAHFLVVRNSAAARSLTDSNYFICNEKRYNITGIPDKGPRPQYLEMSAKNAK